MQRLICEVSSYHQETICFLVLYSSKKLTTNVDKGNLNLGLLRETRCIPNPGSTLASQICLQYMRPRYTKTRCPRRYFDIFVAQAPGAQQHIARLARALTGEALGSDADPWLVATGTWTNRMERQKHPQKRISIVQYRISGSG